MLRQTFQLGCMAVALGFVLAGCSTIPTSGPSTSRISQSGQAATQVDRDGIQVVDVTNEIAHQLFAERGANSFFTTLGSQPAFNQQLGVGDAVEISIWEAPPATLFGAGGGSSHDAKSAAAGGSQVTALPEQMINGDGAINVPFVGQIRAAGLTPVQLQNAIVARLKNIAHDPQVLVKLSRNVTSYVTVVGDVVNSSRLPLTAHGERVLDMLAASGGVKQPVDKVTIQITRGDKVLSMPLESVIRDPRQNVPLHSGDVMTALFQPYSFMALGATGKNEEIGFEAQGITLAQAIARSGGLLDSRSDAQGVFIFRLEDANALKWNNTPVRTTADGKVPVVYRVNFRDPNAFFVAQNFMMDNKDILYVSNAPVAELQKFLNVVFSVAYPVITGVQVAR
ncbi:polysaccharide biosynthesis/export family protein [Burkholderia gladioli]|uniref:polysaccharide biosynthesis/export family protein n=1 Tax=Burkholderia gladioli TaxID=28095 RepID=UPI001641277E|nr:polysaccharide biosynthesis/export family protein [Burkholderia gladioli]